MYAKLFTSILTSSIWEEDYATRVVWVSLLAMANEDGIIEAIPSAIARIANMQPKEVEAALGKFQRPDPASRSPEHEGRRIEKIEGGYAILNYPKYREMKTRTEQREEWRKKKQQQREKQNVPNVSKCPPMSTYTYTDADTDADAELKATSPTSADAAPPPESEVPVTPAQDHMATVNLVNQLWKQAKMTGSKKEVFREIADLLSMFTAEEISEEITRSAPGENPWDAGKRLKRRKAGVDRKGEPARPLPETVEQYRARTRQDGEPEKPDFEAVAAAIKKGLKKP